MKRIGKKNLEELGEIIKVLGHEGLSIYFSKHRLQQEEVDSMVARLPERFHMKQGGDSNPYWKAGTVFNMYGVNTVEVSLFYRISKKKGGE